MTHPTPHATLTKQQQHLSARNTTRFYASRALLFFLALSTLAFLLFTHPAVAKELAPTAPGIITGVVKSTTGEPRTGITVTLYQLDRTDTTVWRALRRVTTQVDGGYRFTFLPTSLYRIGADDAQRIYAPAYYPAAPVISQGQDIAVTGDQRQNIDITLQPAGQITGVITLSDGLTMTSGLVELRQEDENATGKVWKTVQSMQVVATHGVYSFTGLAALPYRVCAMAAYQTRAATECYDNVYEVQAATSLTLTAGATISNVNLLLGDGADYGQLRGQVTTPANEPLAQIEVYAMPVIEDGVAAAQPFSSALLTSSTAPNADTHALYTPDPLYYAQSDDTGHYHFTALAEGRIFLTRPAAMPLPIILTQHYLKQPLPSPLPRKRLSPTSISNCSRPVTCKGCSPFWASRRPMPRSKLRSKAALAGVSCRPAWLIATRVAMSLTDCRPAFIGSRPPPFSATATLAISIRAMQGGRPWRRRKLLWALGLPRAPILRSPVEPVLKAPLPGR